jgi:hypothetical protein
VLTLSQVKTASDADLYKSLTDRRIGGKDLPRLLEGMAAFYASDQLEVAIEHDRVTGLKGYRSEEDALTTAPFLENSIKEILKNESCRSDTVMAGTKVGQRVVHLGFECIGSEFLTPVITVSTVLTVFGPSKTVSHQLVQVGPDGRTESLTTYSYGEGAVQFVQSTYASRVPGQSSPRIDKVVLKTRVFSDKRR